jgi:hypothetical protein
MSFTKRPNRPPNNTETTTLNKLIAQEEAILAAIQKLEREREEERVRLLHKSSILQRTIQSMKAIQDAASQMSSGNAPLLKTLEKEIVSQEAGVSAISECLPSINIEGFLKELRAITLYSASLQSALERQLQTIGVRINSVDEELESTVELEGHMAETISSASTMISTAKDIIKKKRQGLLHPIRRLPVEMLEEIFQACVDEETGGWFDDPAITPDLPKAAMRVASVCRFWRSVALQCPRLWSNLRAPAQYNILDRNSPRIRTFAAGVDHFRSSLQRRGGIAIELTIPSQVSIPEDVDIMAVPLHRLNLLNVASQWPPTFPSPLHLWLGQPVGSDPLTRAIPSSLIARTKTITAFCVSLTFDAPSHTINHLIISGQQPTIPFVSLLTSLPNLAELDVTHAQISQVPVVGTRQNHNHSKLRCIRLHSSCLATIEQCLSDGLQLLRLRNLTLSNLTSSNSPLLYPFVSAQFSATVTSLEIHGAETTDSSLIRSFIDKFHRINTLSINGTAVSAALSALYEVYEVYEPPPRKTKKKIAKKQIVREMPEWVETVTIREMPERVETIIIQDYKGDGSAIHQVLQVMRSHPATGTQPISVVFEECPNIRKDIREEFAMAGPMIVIEPPDRDLGPICDPYDPAQLSDHILDELDAADGELG